MTSRGLAAHSIPSLRTLLEVAELIVVPRHNHTGKRESISTSPCVELIAAADQAKTALIGALREIPVERTDRERREFRSDKPFCFAVIECSQRRVEREPSFRSVLRRIFDKSRNDLRPAQARLALTPPLDHGEIATGVRIREQPTGAFVPLGVWDIRSVSRPPIDDRSELQRRRTRFQMDRDPISDCLDRTGATPHSAEIIDREGLTYDT